NIYASIKVIQLHQLLNGVFKDHTWDWIIDFLKHKYDAEKALELIDERFFALPCFSYILQSGNKLTQVTSWTSSGYNDMLKVLLAAPAPLFTGHPNHLKLLKCVTDFILIAGFHSHTKTTLQYLQDTLHHISRNIHLCLPYCHNQYIRKILIIHSLFHYIECIKEINSTNNNDNIVSEAANKNLIKDCCHESNKDDYIQQMLR
ncbi:hypothetical protein K440DRAFT_504277, partial [Wilcoxina mikolae CBS 423.85]